MNSPFIKYKNFSPLYMQELLLECLQPIVGMNIELYRKLLVFKNKSGPMEMIRSYDFLFVLGCLVIAIVYFLLARKLGAITFNSMFVIFIYVILRLFREQVGPTIEEIDQVIRNFLVSKNILDSGSLSDGEFMLGYYATSLLIVLILLLAKKLFYFTLFISGLCFGYGIYKNWGLSEYFKTTNFAVELMIVTVVIVFIFYTCRWGFRNVVLLFFSFIGSVYVLTFVTGLAGAGISTEYWDFLDYLYRLHKEFDKGIAKHARVLFILAVSTCVSFMLQRTSVLK